MPKTVRTTSVFTDKRQVAITQGWATSSKSEGAVLSDKIRDSIKIAY